VIGDELEFVEWLASHQPRHPAVKLGVGDDMAVVDASGGRGEATAPHPVLISSDMLLDGVHYETARHALSRIGRKAIACALSDCAAMAVRPLAATVSLALPAARSLADARELYSGMWAVAREYDLAIVGGDTTRWNHPLAIDVTIMASPYEGIEPVTRSGAQRGDTLHVTGPLGGSLMGRHLDFVPRVREAHALAEQFGDRLHAMLDISDGLSLDLWRMCRASGVGATLSERLLERVISEDARKAAVRDGTSALEHALGDGEDFELLLSVSGDTGGSGVTLYPVGKVTEADLMVQRKDGRTEPMEPKGYVH
jgi:thiamine-monophosphate kinase